MDNVLITGGTGLIGRHLSNKLKENGYSVSS
jgi:nucleoside-diphosphate-sugar epimerase